MPHSNQITRFNAPRRNYRRIGTFNNGIVFGGSKIALGASTARLWRMEAVGE